MYFYKFKNNYNQDLKSCATFELLFSDKEEFILKNIILKDEKVIKKFLLFLIMLRDKRLTEFEDFNNEYFKTLLNDLSDEVFIFENKVLLDIFSEYKLVSFFEEFYDENGNKESIIRYFSDTENKFFKDVENYLQQSTQCKIYKSKLEENERND